MFRCRGYPSHGENDGMHTRQLQFVKKKKQRIKRKKVNGKRRREIEGKERKKK